MREPARRWATVLVTALAITVGGPVAAVGATTDEGTYVTRVYRDLFHRTPDPEGLATWVAALGRGTPREAVANSITGSDEYRSRLITGAYDHYLGRGPDASGLRFWLGQMRSGMQIEQMTAGFLASDEFFARGGSTATGWVTLLYQTVLDRSPGAPETASWVRAIGAGTDRASVARGFLYSTEHLSSVVDGYYTDLLGRHLDPSGQATWVGLIQAGHRDEEIIAAIVSSAEYRQLATQPDREVRLGAVTTGQTCAAGVLVGGAVTWTTPLPAGITSAELLSSGARVAAEPVRDLAPGAYTLRVRVAGGYRLVDAGAGVDPSGYYLVPATVAAFGGRCSTTPAASVRVGLGLGGAEPNGHAINIAISGDGSWVAFDSDSSNLVAGDDNGQRDVFVTNVATGQTLLVSRTADGSPANRNSDEPSISADGRWVAFRSEAYDLPGGSYAGQVYLWDRNDGSVTLVSRAADGSPARDSSWGASISADGRWITFASHDTHLVEGGEGPSAGSYVFDRVTGAVTNSPVGSIAAYSLDRRWFAYQQPTSNAVLWDSATDTRRLLLTGADASVPVVANAVSQDGRWVAFTARASALVPSTTNYEDTVFLWDAATGQHAPVALSSSGGPSNGKSTFFGMSADGTRLVYVSSSTDIPGGGSTGVRNAAWYDRLTGSTTLVAVGLGGVLPNKPVYHAAMSADGHVIAYTSNATNLVPGGTNGLTDVFVTRLD